MPIPLIGIAIGALVGKSSNKTKDDFQAVRGPKRKDGTQGKPYIRGRAKKK